MPIRQLVQVGYAPTGALREDIAEQNSQVSVRLGHSSGLWTIIPFRRLGAISVSGNEIFAWSGLSCRRPDSSWRSNIARC